MYKSNTVLLVGMVLAMFLAACTPSGPAETTPQKPPTNTTPPLTGTTLISTLSSPTSTHAPSPTQISLESTNSPSADSVVVDFCQEPNGTIGLIDVTPTPAAGISVDLDRLIPPAPPGRVEAQNTADGVQLSWQGTGTDVDQFYQVYRMEVDDDCWELIGVEPVVGNNQIVYTFSIPDSAQPGAFSYAVTTMDIYGNESDISTAVQLNTDS